MGGAKSVKASVDWPFVFDSYGAHKLAPGAVCAVLFDLLQDLDFFYLVAVASGGDLSVKDQCQCEELYKNGLDRIYDVSFEHFSLMVAGTCV